MRPRASSSPPLPMRAPLRMQCLVRTVFGFSQQVRMAPPNSGTRPRARSSPRLLAGIASRRPDPSTGRTKPCAVEAIPASKRGDERARGRVPEFGGAIRTCCENPNTVRTKHCILNGALMGKGGDELARGRIPEFGRIVCARGQNPSTVRTKLRVADPILVGKGGDELARGRIPELGGVVCACR